MEKKWSLAVLLNLKELSEAQNQQRDNKQRIKLSVIYFVLPFACKSTVSYPTEDEETMVAQVDVSLELEEPMETKIREFIDACLTQ